MRSFALVIIALAMLIVPQLTQANDLLWDEDRISNATVLLYQKLDNAKASIGSGTILSRDGKYYILTASHVSKQMKKDAKVVLRLKGDKPSILDLFKISKDKSLKWKQHSVADIAIIELETQDKSIKTILEDYAFPAELIHGRKELPTHGADLTFLGYPIVDMEMEHFSPLIFTAYLSSGLITQTRADTKTKCNFYYLSVPAAQGCSGSGVYFSVKKATLYYGGSKTLMIGVVHGTQSDDTGGKLAAITPSYYISELFKD